MSVLQASCDLLAHHEDVVLALGKPVERIVVPKRSFEVDVMEQAGTCGARNDLLHSLGEASLYFIHQGSERA